MTTANFEITVTNDTSDDITTENYDGTLVAIWSNSSLQIYVLLKI